MSHPFMMEYELESRARAFDKEVERLQRLRLARSSRAAAPKASPARHIRQFVRAVWARAG